MYIHHINKNFYLKIVYIYEIENLRAITTCNRFSRILTYLGAQEGGNSELRFWIPRQFSSAPKLRDGTHACHSYRDSTGQIIRFQQEATSKRPRSCWECRGGRALVWEEHLHGSGLFSCVQVTPPEALLLFSALNPNKSVTRIPMRR